MSGSYDDDGVGYKRPPKHAQFQRGHSGNPRGRPKKRPSFRSDLEEELGALTTIKEGETTLEVSKRRAIVKALVNAAMERNPRVGIALLNYLAKIPADDEGDENSPEEAEILEIYRKNHNSTPSQDLHERESEEN